VLEMKGHGGTSGRVGISTPPREKVSQLAKDGEGGDGYLVRTVPVQVSRNKVRYEWLFTCPPRLKIGTDMKHSSAGFPRKGGKSSKVTPDTVPQQEMSR